MEKTAKIGRTWQISWDFMVDLTEKINGRVFSVDFCGDLSDNWKKVGLRTGSHGPIVRFPYEQTGDFH